MKSRLIITLALSTLIASAAFGQATRTWVSGVGDDVNPCSRTAPCKTFAGAISKTAPGGQISVLDPGGFGGVTITKGMTIDGAGTLASVLNSSGQNGILVNAQTTDTVILRNLQIDGAGSGNDGVRILQAKMVIIEDTIIMGQNIGIDVIPSTALASLNVHNVDIQRCATFGVNMAPTSAGIVIAFLNDVRVSSVGSASNHDGVLATGSSNVQATKLQVFKAAGAGMHVTNGAQGLVENSNFYRNVGAGVEVGGAGAGAIVRVSGTGATQNSGAGFLASAGGTLFSYRDNRSSDNGVADSGNTQAFFY